jgi:hypothetical protein
MNVFRVFHLFASGIIKEIGIEVITTMLVFEKSYIGVEIARKTNNASVAIFVYKSLKVRRPPR